jgi:hypothetical protein
MRMQVLILIYNNNNSTIDTNNNDNNNNFLEQNPSWENSNRPVTQELSVFGIF